MKFRLYLLLSMAAASVAASATTYLCVPEASAVVTHRPNGDIESSVGHSDKKWLFTNDEGKWVVKEVGENHAFFDSCETEYHCESKNGFAGFFLRNSSGNIFTVVWFTKNGDAEMLVSTKGKCSKVM